MDISPYGTAMDSAIAKELGIGRASVYIALHK